MHGAHVDGVHDHARGRALLRRHAPRGREPIAASGDQAVVVAIAQQHEATQTHLAFEHDLTSVVERGAELGARTGHAALTRPRQRLRDGRSQQRRADALLADHVIGEERHPDRSERVARVDERLRGLAHDVVARRARARQDVIHRGRDVEQEYERLGDGCGSALALSVLLDGRRERTHPDLLDQRRHHSTSV